MKSMKKLLAFALVLVMLTALAITASAASITIKSTTAVEGETVATSDVAITYTYYKILSADVETDPVVTAATGETATAGKAAYYVTTQAQATALGDTGLFTVTKVDGADKWFVELVEGKTIDDIIAAFDDTFLSNFTAQTFTKDAGTADAAITGLDAGYYFIKSSIGTKVAVQTLSDIEIIEKNTYPALKKEFGSGSWDIAGIGEEVPFKVTVTIPENVLETDLKIVDTITKGLTLNTAVTVTGGTDYSSATFALDVTNDDGSKVYSFTIPAATVKANAGNTLVFEYTATVNKDAVVVEPEKNTAHLEYANNAIPDTPPVETFPVAYDVQKVDSADKSVVLSGAEFTLKNAASTEVKVTLIEAASDSNGNVNVYRVAVDGDTAATITGGTFRIEGLNDEEYTLTETKAPTGYKLGDTVDFKFTPSEDSSTTDIDLQIENTKGATLPSTGGIGTTLFYVIGSVLFLGAGIVLVTKRRVRE